MASVGLVVVSHSRTLAEGVAELAREMGVGSVRVEPAGGDAAGGMGTCVDLVEAAVRRVDTGDGVVLLADIGSSVLTARMLVEDADGVALADAPLVEGAVAAASAAAAGAELAAVVTAAEDAYRHRKT